MKKIIASVALLSLIFIVGCGEKKTTEVMKLSFATQESPSHNMYAGYEAFAKELEKLSGGKMVVEIFHSSQLGDFKATVQQLQSGELDMCTTGYPDMAYLIPELTLVGQAYVVRDYEHLLKVVNSEYGKKMNEEFKKNGVDLLSVWYGGMRQTTANKALNSINDFKGLKLRVPNVEFLLDYAKSTGAIPSPVAFAELYLALQTGQVEAQENPLPTIDANKIYEVQKFIAMTSHFVASTAILMSDKTYAKLTDQQKKWVNDALEVGKKTSNDLMFAGEADLIKKFEGMGIKFTYPDLAPFRDAMKPYYSKLEDKFGKGSIQKLVDIQ